MSDKDDKELKGAEALQEMSRRLGGLLGGLTGALDAAARSAAGRAADQGGAARETTEADLGTGGKKAKIDVSFRVGTVDEALAARASANDAGPAPRKPRGAQGGRSAGAGWGSEGVEEAEIREVEIEVFDAADAVTATAELPGVAADALTLTLEDGAVVLATSGARRFAGRAEIPQAAALDWEARDVRLLNGVLEVRLPKKTADD